ncbi:MAG: F0F1 ATP synthase subunit delta [Bacteroidaceae bacterium]|nr:F0F1 ATP synthase subunit delta [Bacteroidaceae bacterium]
MGTISKRYAKALYLYAKENGVEEKAYTRMKRLMDNLQKLKELQKTLENPILEKEHKLTLLIEASGGGEDAVFNRFMELVLTQRREACLPFIAHSFIDFYREQKQIHVGKLTTAVPLTEKGCERIRNLITDSMSGTVELETKVDSGIGGGFILQVGSQRMDASITGQLQHLRRKFSEFNHRNQPL